MAPDQELFLKRIIKQYWKMTNKEATE